MSADPVARAIAALDAANAKDPRQEAEGPHELAYARRMSAWLERLRPEASDALRLAVRAQHLERWLVPRTDYPGGKAGYLRWRLDLGRRHAARAGEILAAEGIEPATIARVQALIRKEGLRTDPETQALEDAACLVFLETELASFAAGRDPEKLVDIVRKTWRKMSEGGRSAALGLALDPAAKALVERALSERD